MASFFRRKRGLIFKFIVGIPALWFLIVIFTTYQGKLSDSDDEKRQEREIIHRERDIVPPQNNHIHLGDSDKLNHDRKIHAEERQDLDQKIQADKRESEHQRAEKVQAPVVEEKNDDTLRYRKKEPLPERPYVDPNAPGMIHNEVKDCITLNEIVQDVFHKDCRTPGRSVAPEWEVIIT